MIDKLTIELCVDQPFHRFFVSSSIRPPMTDAFPAVSNYLANEIRGPCRSLGKQKVSFSVARRVQHVLEERGGCSVVTSVTVTSRAFWSRAPVHGPPNTKPITPAIHHYYSVVDDYSLFLAYRSARRGLCPSGELMFVFNDCSFRWRLQRPLAAFMIYSSIVTVLFRY